MKKSPVLLFFLLSCFTFTAFSQNSPESASKESREDLTGADSGESRASASVVESMKSVLGQTLEELVESCGLPDDLYALRGPTPGQDSVVFYYSDSYTYYLADGHVWQVRADRNDLFQDDDLSLGLPAKDVESLMGDPQRSGEDYSIYSLVRSGFPVAAAFYFDEGLSDLYVYRSDF